MKTTALKRPAPREAWGKKALKAKLVRIGNSRGVRLPKTVIDQAGLTTDVEIAVKDNEVIIRSAGEGVPRARWEEQIRRTLLQEGEGVDQAWLDAPLANQFDDKEWTW